MLPTPTVPGAAPDGPTGAGEASGEAAKSAGPGVMQWADCPCCRRKDCVPVRDIEGAAVCLICRKEVNAVLLPALAESGAPPPPPQPPTEGEAACFYSPERRADHVCDQCGVLVSSRWAGKWGARRICLPCLEKLRAGNRSADFESGRTAWDNICLILALVPFTPFTYWAAILTAPTALFLGIWHWKKPRGMVPRGPWRMILALVLAGGQVLLMLAGLFFLIRFILIS